MKNVAILNTCISGSTGKIAVGLFDALVKQNRKPYFYYGREDGGIKEGFYKIGSSINKYIHAGIFKVTGLQGYGSIIPTKHLIKELEKQNIDTLFIISPHGYYINERILWEYVSNNNILVIYLMIDEYAYLGNCGYSGDCYNFLQACKSCPRFKRNVIARMINGPSISYRMKDRYYNECKRIVFVGPEYTIKRAELSPLMCGKRMEILDEAINTSFFYPRDCTDLKERLGINKDDIVCVCIAPYSYERKGCKYFVELAKRFENNDKYRFLQVGFNVNPSSVNLPSNYIPIGFLNDQELLAQYYSLGDIFVFPSLQDTMPNACLEALSSGTPLLLFNISGMPYIADETVATLVEAKNVDQMVEVINKVEKKNDKTIDTCRRYALDRYDNRSYYNKLISIAEEYSR